MNDDDINELLTAIEFAEGALLECMASEEKADFVAVGRVAGMCSDQLVKHGRTSVMVEANKWPVT